MRRSRESNNNVLLDTSLLLPMVGVKVDGAEKLLEELWIRHDKGEVSIYYTVLNLLEISWVLSKVEYDPYTVEDGFRSIETSFNIVPVDGRAILRALELRRKGFKDMIDLILYATAQVNNLRFLTLDKKLISFIDSIGEDLSIFHIDL